MSHLAFPSIAGADWQYALGHALSARDLDHAIHGIHAVSAPDPHCTIHGIHAVSARDLAAADYEGSVPEVVPRVPPCLPT